VDDETLLVIMGDHAWTLRAIMEANQMMKWRQLFGCILRKVFLAVLISNLPLLQKMPKSVDSQIDIVPTLSLLLGMPIPFNNLGSPIEEAFSGHSGRDFQNLATVNRLTALRSRDININTLLHEESGKTELLVSNLWVEMPKTNGAHRILRKAEKRSYPTTGDISRCIGEYDTYFVN